MNRFSQNKVIDAGFTIVRCDDYPCVRIKYKDSDNREWVTYSNYPSKSVRDKSFSELLEHPRFIED